MKSLLKFQDFLNERSKNPCWKGYKQIGTKKKKGKIVPNCVRVNESSDVNFDRLDFYLQYFKNLSPEGFELSKIDNAILISIPKEGSVEPVAGLEIPIVLK